MKPAEGKTRHFMLRMTDSIHAIIDRVRRSTRNQDVITVCDELSRRLVGQALIDAARGREPAPKLSRAEIQRNYRLRKKAKVK